MELSRESYIQVEDNEIPRRNGYDNHNFFKITTTIHASTTSLKHVGELQLTQPKSTITKGFFVKVFPITS